MTQDKGSKPVSAALPGVFQQRVRPDLIQRAVVSDQSAKRQKYGVTERAGLETSADYYGMRRDSFRLTINRGLSRLPREKSGGGGLGRVKRVPQAVKGRRAHPPKGKDFTKKMNSKEYSLALKSAISASNNLPPDDCS